MKVNYEKKANTKIIFIITQTIFFTFKHNTQSGLV